MSELESMSPETNLSGAETVSSDNAGIEVPTSSGGISEKSPETSHRAWLKQIPVGFLVLTGLTVLCAVLQAVMSHSVSWAERMNQGAAFYVRRALAFLTGWIPFSVCELLVLMIPGLLVSLVLWVILLIRRKNGRWIRFPCFLLSVLMVVFNLFVFTLSPGYHTEPLAKKMDLEEQAVSAEQLCRTAKILVNGLAQEHEQVSYGTDGFSHMTYSFEELGEKLNEAYASLETSLPGTLTRFEIRPKWVTLSPYWTYTHISGMYSFFTGESNINTYFPDYCIPFTMAHEMAHQMGIGREDECNFLAFLACLASEDAYVRYSGFLNLYIYLANALYRADPDRYWEVYGLMETACPKVLEELAAYNRFWEPFRETTVSRVSDAVNDSYLSVQGTEGVASYGLVVDLAVAFFEKYEI